ncbi:hypothetical protein PFMALIP_03533 [Plasmodium falciparum MaliPS096_E11]|uniref:Duffy-antigen binding domain-containing protein n=1 Tax=Plasmodium falciparum MaliPS096_E11 TaxID=1036727 RepID=A0A024WNA2_PLAFA|nr:hypothetical protein PFMALIP_03533 [Plasmodium falciparum MaliPS096_E11]
MGVEHIGIAKPQFIRWLEEWTNEFCEKYTKYFEDMKSKCNPTKSADDCDDNTNIECKKACANYTNWLNPKRIEWNGMSNYYNKIYRKSNKESEDGKDYSMIMEPTVIDYLNKRCHGEINGNYICCSCKNIGENSTSPVANKKAQRKDEDEEEKGPLDLMNEVLNKMDPKYSKLNLKCTEVYLEHVEEQLKEIDNAIKDYQLYPLDRCFDDKSKMKVCDLIGDAIGCKDKTKLDELDEWNDVDMRGTYNKHKGVLIPPRRRQLCFSRIVRGPANLRSLNEFKEEILKGAQSEGKFLGNYYNEDKGNYYKEHKDKEKALEAMKNSFYDYEDIIKGTDMLTNIEFKDIKRKLDKLLTKETNNNIRNAEDWWKVNNKSIWNAMLCGYKKSGNKIIDPSWCTIPTTEKTPQFLRWIKEWGTNVCIQKQEHKEYVKSKCSNVTNIDLDPQASESTKCTPEIKKYQEWSRKRSIQWDAISERYKKYKGKDEFKNVKEPDANTYLKEHCSKCPCGFNDMEEIANDTENKQDIFKQIIEKVKIPAELEDVIYRLKHHEYDKGNDYICNKYKNINVNKRHKNDDTWTDLLVKNSSDINKGVLIPPRRKNLFLNIEKSDICEYKKDPKLFKDFIYSSAFTEVERLKIVYRQDKEKVANAMKYSFADIGNIIKGDDMMESPTFRYIEEIFSDMKYKGIDRTKWWNKNKYHVWESMLCGYREAGGYKETVEKLSEKKQKCTFPDIESVPQFLRWFQEWTEHFCTRRNELYDIMVTKCEEAQCDDTTGRLTIHECTEACRKYENYILQKKQEYFGQKKKYDKDFKDNNKKDAPYYFKYSTYLNKSDCLHDNFKDDNKWKNPYESLGNETLKGKCQCMKTTAKPVPAPDVPSPDKKEIPPVNPDETDTPLPPPVSPPLPSDEPFDPTILQTTIPLGVALALGSIAFLFMKKKRNKGKYLLTLQTDIQNDAIPTCVCEKSLADKVEKGCLRCGYGLGTVAPTVGLIGAVAVHAWKPTALKAAIAAALEANNANILAAAIKAGNAHGTKIVTTFLEKWGIKVFYPDLFKSIGTKIPYTNAGQIANSILGKFNVNCKSLHTGFKASAGCNEINIKFGIFTADGERGFPANYIIPRRINRLVEKATQGAAEAAKKASESATAAITKKQTALIEAGFNNSITSIYASIIAILVIVLIMVIIYLILRYRRKKKMKKKLQYIKLLEE